jgi:hypothetical protein
MAINLLNCVRIVQCIYKNVVNSRIGSDLGVGKKTCKDISVVYYLIVSSHLFAVISDFSILDFNPITSNVHNIIHFSLKSVDTVTVKPQVDNSSSPLISWIPYVFTLY